MQRKRTLGACLVAAAALVSGLLGFEQAQAALGDHIVERTVHGGGRRDVTLLSRTHTIDRLYESMQGPSSNQEAIRLLEEGPPELLWVTGLKSELVGPEGSSAASREFFCHSNLTFTPGAVSGRRTAHTFTPVPDLRLITLVPGRLNVQLPEGFAVPIYSDEPLDYYSMSLNLNQQDRTQRVRFKTTISFTRDADADRPLKPLFRRALYAYEEIGKASHTMCQTATHPGAACGVFVGQQASNAFLDSIGKTNTMHWMIPPGHYERRVPVTDQFELPSDTTAHYVTAHLHPFAKFVSLVDATTGTTLFTLRSQDFADRRGVAHIDEWKSIEGMPLYRAHNYELITVYENPTEQPVDAMSILYVYAFDQQFQTTQHASVARRSSGD